MCLINNVNVMLSFKCHTEMFENYITTDNKNNNLLDTNLNT